jgi:hypothetical protein
MEPVLDSKCYSETENRIQPVKEERGDKLMEVKIQNMGKDLLYAG